ncbi:MAG: hypothetical protein HY423_01590 [Candidatus Lambdaproteobacteria bacterium]|nr:hypothetical protein [Candidatus Lambdaproteobacteria bacterium]
MAKTSKALIVLESPWFDLEQDPKQRTSIRPFLQGLADFYDASLYYSMFHNLDSFNHSVKRYEDVKAKSHIIYVASHGKGGRVAAVGRQIQLKRLLECIPDNYEALDGIMLGACDVGNSKAVQYGLKRNRACWIFGYRHAVDWMASTLVDMAILDEVLVKGRTRSRSQTITAFAKALHRFDGNWVIADDGAGRPMPIKKTIALWFHERRPGTQPRLITGDLLARLARQGGDWD